MSRPGPAAVTIALAAAVLLAAPRGWSDDRPAGLRPGDAPTTQPAGSAIRIAAILPLTGELAPVGQSARQGLELAVGQINRDGGVAGRPMQLVFVDTQSRPGMASDLAQRAVTAEQPDALIGGLDGPTALAVRPIADKRKVLFLVLSGGYRPPPNAGRYACRVSTSDEQLADGLARFAREDLRAAVAWAVLDVSGDQPTLLPDRFVAQFARHGGRVAGIESVSANRDGKALPEMAARLAGLARLDVVLAALPAESLIALAGHVRRKLPGVPLLAAAPPWVVPSLLADGAGAVRPAYLAVPFAPDDPDPRVRKFVADLSAASPATEPDVFAATAYDSVLLLAEAARRREKAGGELRDRLAAVRDLPGVLGPMTVDDAGDVVRPVAICRLAEPPDGAAGNRLVFVRRASGWPAGPATSVPSSQPAGNPR